MVTPFPETSSYLLVVLFPGLFLTEEKKLLICQRGQKHLVAFPMWCPPWHPLSQFLRRLSPVVSPHMPTPGLTGRGSCFKSEVSNDTLINKRKKKTTPPQLS